MATELLMRPADSTRPAARADRLAQWQSFRQPPSWLRWLIACRVVVYFLIGLVALDLLIYHHRALWHAYDPHPYRERLDICRNQTWDLVVVGGSPAAYAINPLLLEGLPWQGRTLKRACNVALPLATAAEVYHITANGIRRRPRLLIYGICATEFKEDRVEPLGPMFLMNASDVVRWARLRPDAAPWCAGKFLQERWENLCAPMYYRTAVQRWAAEKLDDWFPGLCAETAEEAHKTVSDSVALYLNHGFQAQPATPERRLDLLKASGKPLQGWSFLENYAVSGYLVYLHALLDWAEARRVPVVLVELPTSADLERKFPEAFAAFRARLREIERDRQVRVLRPTRAQLGLEERHYADIIHLNADGAAVLTAWLRRELAQP